MKKLYLAAFLCLAPVAIPTAFSGSAMAQSSISGDLTGTITDPTGAAVPGASVTILNLGTGKSTTSTASESGAYRASLLQPGNYKVSVTAAGFDTTTVDVTISQGTVTSGDVKLSVGKSSTVVEVNVDTQPLLQTEDAQISTTFNLEQVQSLPNPGNDVTYFAQTTPGVIMNTGGGYGNFSAFGLPGTSNNFTVNGFQQNDPFLNLNNSGPSNLLLGENDVESVNVIGTAYGAEFGSFGGVQESIITRSGTNHFHGNVTYWWNGRSLNANNFFLNDVQQPRPFSNSNQWAAAVGGPIQKDKTFFFVNTEGLRFITAPTDLNYVPSPAYAASVVGTNKSCNNATSSLYVNGAANECAYYNNIFALYAGAPGIGRATAVDGDPDALQFYSSPKIFAKESLVTARLDHVFGPKDTAFLHFEYDNGTQPTHVDPINVAFNDISNQPEYNGQIVQTHVFSANITNQLNIGVAHYSAFFQSVNQSAASALFPGTLELFDPNGTLLSLLGGIGYVFPQGRNATQYAVADDFSWIKGKHTMKFGYAFKKDDITDYDSQVLTNPLAVSLDFVGTFSAGENYEYIQGFPNHYSQPLGLYSEGFYGQDTYKVVSNLSLTAGVRLEHNSNAVSPNHQFSRLNGSFAAATAGNNYNTPYNSEILSGQRNLFSHLQTVSVEPRVEMVWSPFGKDGKTVLRGGFGMFSDVFPGQVADDSLSNIPQAPQITVYFAPIAPNVPDSSATLASQAAASFKSGFPNGATFNTLNAALAAAGGFTQPGLTTSDPNIHLPTYEEYSLQIQQALTRNTSVQVAYAGNHGYHEPVVNGNINGYGTNLAGGTFTGIPTAPPAESYGAVTNISSTANSNYNGMVASVIHRSKYVNLQMNYAWAQSLDQVSNGGFLGFTSSSITNPLAANTLKYNYGRSDYDVRNSLNGNYVAHLPYFGGPKALTDGWQIAGTIFYRAGFPFTVVDSNITNDFVNYSGSIPALVTNKNVARHCSQSAVADSHHPTADCFNISSATGSSTDFTDPSGLIPGQRNAFTGPHFFDTDLTISKSFALPFEQTKFLVSAAFFNVLNHPNFGNPDSDYASPTFGQILNTVNLPTSIYGSGLGGDTSPRIIQLQGKFTF